MYSLKKWIFKPKKTDDSFLAQFYYADEELNTVAAELDSFDGRKEPERCSKLINRLRSCQEKVLGIMEKIIEEAIPTQRASRGFRVKFPDDVIHDSLAGQLWFGAECLAAGSSIMNREVESASLRPLARSLTRCIDQIRSLLREQSCQLDSTKYPHTLKSAFSKFDQIFADFELGYVSAMVPVKSMREFEQLEEVAVLFSETTARALKRGLLCQDALDTYDPAVMFTVPRLAIICGLTVYPDGPLNPDMDPINMSDMFRPYQTLLYKVRQLLATLSPEEMEALERSLCHQDDPRPVPKEPSQDSGMPSSEPDEPRIRCLRRSSSLPGGQGKEGEVGRVRRAPSCRSLDERSRPGEASLSSSLNLGLLACPALEKGLVPRQPTGEFVFHLPCNTSAEPQMGRPGSPVAGTSSNVASTSANIPRYCRSVSCPTHRRLSADQLSASSSDSDPFQPGCSGVADPCPPSSSQADPCPPRCSEADSWPRSCLGMGSALDEAEQAAQHEARARFKDSAQLLQRLFVCISGVADQLQTNFASDLRHILKWVLECNSSNAAPEDENQSSEDPAAAAAAEGTPEPPTWVPDEEAPECSACKVAFTFVRRRHHCRNCGRVFCGRCSANNVPLPMFGHDKPVRVCNRCFMFHVTPFTVEEQ